MRQSAHGAAAKGSWLGVEGTAAGSSTWCRGFLLDTDHVLAHCKLEPTHELQAAGPSEQKHLASFVCVSLLPSHAMSFGILVRRGMSCWMGTKKLAMGKLVQLYCRKGPMCTTMNTLLQLWHYKQPQGEIRSLEMLIGWRRSGIFGIPSTWHAAHCMGPELAKCTCQEQLAAQSLCMGPRTHCAGTRSAAYGDPPYQAVDAATGTNHSQPDSFSTCSMC